MACRYASRPPSDPTNLLPFKSLAPSQALSLFGRFSLFVTFTAFFREFPLSPRGYKLSTRLKSPVTYGQHVDMHVRVISTKIVTRWVTISVVSTSKGRRFDASTHSSLKIFRNRNSFSAARRRSRSPQSCECAGAGCLVFLPPAVRRKRKFCPSSLVMRPERVSSLTEDSKVSIPCARPVCMTEAIW